MAGRWCRWWGPISRRCRTPPPARTFRCAACLPRRWHRSSGWPTRRAITPGTTSLPPPGEGADGWAICDGGGALREKLAPDPPAALVELAGIVDFDLFISSTPDRLLSQALARQRAGVLAGRHGRR